jgi:hypothetical protein
VPTSAAVKAYVDANSGPKAWVRFNGVPANGTYSRTGTLVTVTLTGHGMTTGQGVSLDFTTGAATDGFYTITVVDANTFTVTDSASGSTSGNVTRNVHVRASFNVSSVTRAAAGGDYTINGRELLRGGDGGRRRNPLDGERPGRVGGHLQHNVGADRGFRQQLRLEHRQPPDKRHDFPVRQK